MDYFVIVVVMFLLMFILVYVVFVVIWCWLFKCYIVEGFLEYDVELVVYGVFCDDEVVLLLFVY